MPFDINVELRIVTPSETGQGNFLVLLDDNGDFPNFNLSEDSNLENQLLKELDKFLYQSDLAIVSSTKMISSIESQNNKLNIVYNFISATTASKIGSFIPFNKSSIELRRLAGSNQI